MSKVFNMVGGGGATASIFVTGLSETDTVTATKGAKALTGKWTQILNPVAHGVPEGYTELEYIESTGTQYIIPNINIVNGLYTKCVFRPTDLNTDNHVLSSRTSTGFLFAAWQQKTNGVGFAFGSSDSKNTFTSYSSSDVVITQETTILSNTAKSSFNGTEFASIDGTASNVNSAPLYLFCMYDSGTASYFAKVKLYELFASVNGVPAHDFIPAKRNSDGAIGLYDIVSNTFFENAGTGEFVAGSEVPQTIDGHMLAPIRDFGTWTVTATDGTKTATQDVLVDVITAYEIEMDLTKLYLYKDGVSYDFENYHFHGTIASYGNYSAAGKATTTKIDLSKYEKICWTSPIVGHRTVLHFAESKDLNTLFDCDITLGSQTDGVQEYSIADINDSRYVAVGGVAGAGSGDDMSVVDNDTYYSVYNSRTGSNCYFGRIWLE